jgi:hypothetical protein
VLSRTASPSAALSSSGVLTTLGGAPSWGFFSKSSGRVTSAVAYIFWDAYYTHRGTYYTHRDTYYTPRRLLHTPRRLLHTPRHLLHTPRRLLHTPRRPLHTPKHLLHTPRRLLQTPKHLLHTPRHLLHTPRHLLHTPKRLLYTPRRHTPRVGLAEVIPRARYKLFFQSCRPELLWRYFNCFNFMFGFHVLKYTRFLLFLSFEILQYHKSREFNLFCCFSHFQKLKRKKQIE